MVNPDHPQQSAVQPKRFSFVFIAGALVSVAWLKLSMLLLAALFSYLALRQLGRVRLLGRWPAVAIFVFLLLGIGYSLAHFSRHAVKALPEIADKSIPSIIQFAQDHQIELPFTDYQSLKEAGVEAVKSQVHYLASFARFAGGAAKQAVFLLAGCFVAMSLFLTPRFDLSSAPALKGRSLYATCCQEIGERFTVFYESFERVIGAQIAISGVNTVLTAVFALSVGLPYAIVVVGVTFLCGLVPVVGNLVSNTVIVGIGFTVSPRMALLALIFLVTIHKLEYFLNSRIIGRRIHNPLWLTLLALLVGEKVMGIGGLILAPVVLYYVRLEASKVETFTGRKALPDVPAAVQD